MHIIYIYILFWTECNEAVAALWSDVCVVVVGDPPPPWTPETPPDPRPPDPDMRWWSCGGCYVVRCGAVARPLRWRSVLVSLYLLFPEEQLDCICIVCETAPGNVNGAVNWWSCICRTACSSTHACPDTSPEVHWKAVQSGRRGVFHRSACFPAHKTHVSTYVSCPGTLDPLCVQKNPI